MARNAGTVSADRNVMDTLRSNDIADVFLTESRDAIRARGLAFVFSSSATWRDTDKFIGELAAMPRATEAIALVWPSSVLAGDLSRLQGMIVTKTGLHPQQVHCMRVPTYHARAADALLPAGDMEEWAPSTFVEPSLLVDGLVDEATNAFDFIVDRWLKPAWRGPRLLVVLAPAGVGKTTLTAGLRDRMLSGLRQHRDAPRPLLLRSTQWSSLRLDKATLDDVWVRAVSDNYQTPVSLDTLRSFIESGTIVPVMDGFDELCSHGDSFNPTETYEALHALVASSETARIIVTARDGYWASALGALSDDVQEVRAELQQFGGRQIEEFLLKRFPSPAGELRRSDARRMIDRLSSSSRTRTGTASQTLGGLPLVIEMVADVVDQDDSSVVSPDEPSLVSDPVAAVIALACRRERERRGLELSEQQQLELFSELAVYHGPLFDRSILDEAARILFPTLSIRQRVEVLPHHQLLRSNQSGVTFKYEFVRDHFRALQIARELGRYDSALSASAKRILVQEHDGQGPFWEHLGGFEDQEYDPNAVRTSQYWNDRKRVDLSGDERGAESKYTGGLFHLALRTATRDRPMLATERREATERLLSILGVRAIEGAVLAGSIRDLALDGIVFRGCLFENSGFVRCDLAGVSFDECRFAGGFEIVNCSGGDVVEWPSGAGVSAQAAAAFSTQKSLVSKIERQDIVDIVHQILSRFRRGHRLRTLEETVVLSRAMRRSELVRMVMDELERSGIVEAHTISGVGRNAGRNIKADAMREVLRFIENRSPGSLLAPVIASAEARVRAAVVAR